MEDVELNNAIDQYKALPGLKFLELATWFQLPLKNTTQNISFTLTKVKEKPA